MGLFLSTHAGATLYDLTRHATSLRALQKGTDVILDKVSDLRRNSKHRRGGRGNSPGKVNDVNHTGENSTQSTTSTLKYNASAARSSALSPKLQQTAETLSPSGFTPKFIDQAQQCRVCLVGIHRTAQCAFIPHHLRQQLMAKNEHTLKHLPPKTVHKVRNPDGKCAEKKWN